MILKMAAKELEINRKMYTFFLVHVFLMFLIAISFVSVVEEEYEKYAAFEKYIKKDGWYICLFDMLTPDNQVMDSSDTLEGYLKSAQVSSCYTLSGYADYEGKEISADTYIYDAEFLSVYEPELQKGRWLRETDSKTDEIETVISPNTYGLGVGDVLTLHPYGEETEEHLLTAKIVGVLREDASFPGRSLSKDMVSYRNLFCTAGMQTFSILMNHEDILSSEYQISAQEELMRMDGNTFVLWEDGITEEDRAYNLEFLRTYGNIRQIEALPTVLEKSRKAFMEELKQYIPILCYGLIFTFISVICVGLIVSKRQSGNLAVYHMLGLPWKKCVWIQAGSCVLIMAEALFFAVITAFLIWFFRLNLSIRPGIWQLLSCLGIALLCLGIIVLQRLLCRQGTPYELWRKEGE